MITEDLEKTIKAVGGGAEPGFGGVVAGCRDVPKRRHLVHDGVVGRIHDAGVCADRRNEHVSDVVSGDTSSCCGRDSQGDHGDFCVAGDRGWLPVVCL